VDPFDDQVFRALEQAAIGVVEDLTAREPQPGQQVGHYLLHERIGAGGMGVVFRGEDLRLGRPVALKFLHAGSTRDAAGRARIEREARAASALTHASICTVYDVVLDGPRPFIVMEWLDGETLRSRLDREPMPEGVAIEVATVLASALARAHDAGLVHCDIKPANVFLTRHAEVKLLDFGIARRESDRALSEDVAGGTASYMSPEQTRGELLDGRSDMFSLGVLLAKMAPSPRPALKSVIARMTALSPGSRYRDMREAGAAIASARRGRGVLVTAAIALAAAVVMALAGVSWWRAQQPAPMVERDVILIGAIENQTGQPQYDDILRDVVSVSFAQSPYVTVLPDTRLVSVLAQMRRPARETLTAAVAREICEREGIKAFAVGAIALLNGRYQLRLDVINAKRGDYVTRQQEEAASEADVLAASDRLAEATRRQLGESLQSVERFNVPVATATTGSIEAFRLFQSGRQASSQGTASAAGAAAFFRRAIAIDPDFALAWARLGAAHRDLREFDKADDAMRRAFALRERTTERERLEIEANYYGQTSGQISSAAETLEVWSRTYPNDPSPPNRLSAFHKNLGELELAVETGERAVALNPSAVNRSNLAGAYVRVHQYDRAVATVNQAIADKLDNATGHRILHTVARITGDAGMAASADQWMKTRTPDYSYASYHANLAGSEGRIRDARRLFGEAIALTTRAGLDDRDEVSTVRLALLEAYAGHVRQAIAIASQVLATDPNELVIADAAAALAVAGDPRGLSTIDDLARAHPTNQFVTEFWQPLVRGLDLMSRGKTADAIATWRLLDRYDRGDHAWLRPSYHLGTALLAAGDFAGARERFQKVIEYRGVHFNRPLFGLAHLGLARVAAAERSPAAAAAYEKLFAVWESADADLPVVREARRELARLTSTRSSTSHAPTASRD
jgi:tetratricopeptide (TPR) repeat protein